MAVLILAKHDNAHLNDATAKAVTAAKAMGGDIHRARRRRGLRRGRRGRGEARRRRQGASTSRARPTATASPSR